MVIFKSYYRVKVFEYLTFLEASDVVTEIIVQSTDSVVGLQDYPGIDNATQVIVRYNCDYLVYLLNT